MFLPRRGLSGHLLHRADNHIEFLRVPVTMPTKASLPMQALQEAGHGASYDYRAGSPHLKHFRLYDRFVSVLRDEIAAANSKGLPLRVLEVGAGHGGYTEPALAMGCDVTATEMSRPSLSALTRRYGLNPCLSAVFDPTGTLEVLEDQTFSVVICASVLHHVPDYLAFLGDSLLNHLSPGGTLVSVQDPLLYAEMRRTDLFLTKLAYLSWRLTMGNYVEGVRTRLRRIRNIYDEENPLDMVEYHVVRAGLDERALLATLKPRFESARLERYWSTQSTSWQRAGEYLGCTNTFASVARGYRS